MKSDINFLFLLSPFCTHMYVKHVACAMYIHSYHNLLKNTTYIFVNVRFLKQNTLASHTLINN